MLRCWLLLVLNYLVINSRSVTEKLHGSHMEYRFFFSFFWGGILFILDAVI